MTKRLYHTIERTSGDTLTLCAKCVKSNRRDVTEPVPYTPDQPCTCDWCFEMFHPTLRSELAQISKMLNSKELE